MRLLWITNMMLPPLCEYLKLPIPPVGGWMYSSLKAFTNAYINNHIAVATVWDGNEMLEFEIDGIIYYLLPLHGKSRTSYNKFLELYWLKIKESFKPDITHIHGTEYPHGLSYVRACGAENVIVSIQGMISCIAKYYTAQIQIRDLVKCITIRDSIKGGILRDKKKFKKRGKYEIELLSKISHVIGRTEWDKIHSWAINPRAKYYHVGETLRDSFYNYKWKYETCIPYSIFVSQGSYPIKGLHKLLEALPIVLREFPDTKVYVAGTDIQNRPWYKLSSYGNYIKRIIKKYNLENIVTYTGSLNEEQMCKQYLRSNLFVCCSVIENSPNSLGEAQVLGMPHLATFAGGIPEIVNYNKDVLYRFEESAILADKICNVFSKKEKIVSMKFDNSMYDKGINLKYLASAYKNILKSPTL